MHRVRKFTVPMVSIVDPFLGYVNQINKYIYIGSYKVTPKRNYNGDYRYGEPMMLSTNFSFALINPKPVPLCSMSTGMDAYVDRTDGCHYLAGYF